MSIQTVLNNAHTLTDLLPISERLEAKLSFWGRRSLILPISDELPIYNANEVPVDALINRALEILDESKCTCFNYHKNADNARLFERLNLLYVADEINVKNSNIITWIVVFFRDLFAGPSYKNDHLQVTLNNTHTLSELLPIAERLEPKLSFWGKHYVELKSKNGEPNFNHEGIAPLNALVKRIFEVIWKRGNSALDSFSDTEHETCRQLENIIGYLCSTDEKNISRSNIITRIAVVIRNVFQENFQCKWYNDPIFGGHDGQILERPNGAYTIWDNNQRKYVIKSEKNRNLWSMCQVPLPQS